MTRSRDDEIVLTERELIVAQKAAELAIEHVYMEIGRATVKKALWLIGAAAIAIYFGLRKAGWL